MTPNPEILIRPTRPDDLHAICDMSGELAAHHGDVAQVSVEDLLFLTQGPRPWAECLIAEHAGLPIGFAALVRRVQLHMARKLMDLSQLYVAPEWRGQGIGRALIEASVSEARLAGCAEMTLGVHPANPRALSVYERAGFEPRDATGWKLARAL